MSTNFAPDAFDRAVIGVVGGMGPAATGQFLVELAAALPVEYDQDHPRVLVLSDTKVPDRTTCIAAGDPAPGTMVRADLLRAAQLGASVLAVPCNTVHYVIDDFVDELPVQLIHIVDATFTAAMQTSPEGAWLTATAGTVNTGLYQRLAAERDYPLKVPSDEEKAAMMKIIGEVKAGRMTRAGELYRALAGRLRGERELPLMTACTELPLAFEASGLDPGIQISSLTALAHATLEAAAGTVGHWPAEQPEPAEVRPSSPA